MGYVNFIFRTKCGNALGLYGYQEHVQGGDYPLLQNLLELAGLRNILANHFSYDSLYDEKQERNSGNLCQDTMFLV
jgi:hypothetical protein